jgi:TetR/AcrR family transcriptional regulator, transcriptional repressor for nem operon
MKADSDGPFEGLVRYYVSNAHRDAAGAGCIVAALATDVARNESSGLRTVVEDSVSTYIDDLVTVLPGRNKVAKRKAAFAVLSEMIGALILARVTGERLSSELLTTVLEDLLRRRDNYSKS